jgi:[protein-PII] uridylyltransferase
LYALDLNVIGIRASTTATNRPVAIDVFTVTFGGKPVPQATCRQLSTIMTSVLRGEKDVSTVLKDHQKDPDRQQKNFRYTYITGQPGILEVTAPRGRGMAYRFSRLISEQNWNIVTARVSQWAGSGVAAFYLLGPKGEPLVREDVDRALSARV